MAIFNTNTLSVDEKSWQTLFYESIFGSDLDGIRIDRSTDGYTYGIIFEQKQNIKSYGRGKALSQALIYLSRFNRDGVPVPAKICLVSQDENKCIIYNTQDYIEYVENIEEYANLKPSTGIPGFEAGENCYEINFNISSARDMQEIINFVQDSVETVKVHINVHNVYGWSDYYYEHARENFQVDEKKAFFNELRQPKATLKDYIYPWEGAEIDFKYIMDLLNDPETQKKTGAFYTPPEYSRLAADLVKQAIKRAKEAGKNDYIVLDRCAGTGNLEMYLEDADDDILSHTVASTFELKEWMVLKDRFGDRLRYIFPPIPHEKNSLPELDDGGFLSGADALTRDILDNHEIMKYVEDPNCAVILFENPPYVETTGVEFQKKNKGKESSGWKKNYVVKEMAKEIDGSALNDMANAFIWSGFKYFMTDPADSFILFSPAKYWKSQHIVNKKFMGGYAFNKEHFHAKTPSCVTCIYWANETDTMTQKIELKAVNIDDNKELIDEGTIELKKVYTKFSDKYYDKRAYGDDKHDGIVCELNGLESFKSESQIRVGRNYNKNIIGYMLTKTSGFDNPRLSSSLLVAGKYDANGFYLRSDNFMEKLPMFAASRYTDHCNDWKIMSMVMKSGDKAEQYNADVTSGKLDVFLFRTMFWTCMSHYPHMRSLHGSDGRLYLNELCFDGETLARQKMNSFISEGYVLNTEEKTLLKKMNNLLAKIKTDCTDEYKLEFKYGLFQIDDEINISEQIGIKPDGSPKTAKKYGDVNNLIKDIKALAKEYYLKYLVDTLFEYEFLK